MLKLLIWATAPFTSGVPRIVSLGSLPVVKFSSLSISQIFFGAVFELF